MVAAVMVTMTTVRVGEAMAHGCMSECVPQCERETGGSSPECVEACSSLCINVMGIAASESSMVPVQSPVADVASELNI
ncbi:unnamed protein product [Linum trigynum]